MKGRSFVLRCRTFIANSPLPMQRGHLFMVMLFLFCHVKAGAQKGIKGLINAEKQFAWFTATHTVKEGFLSYMDSMGIIFRQGNDVNALEAYKKQPASTGILNWTPAFAVISSSGDMGVTTGPYEFMAKSMQDTPVGRGSFCSIWQINKAGEWKNMADLGTSYKQAAPPVHQVKEVVQPRQVTENVLFEDILVIDKKFNTALQQKNMGLWMQYIASDSWLNIDGELPAMGMLQIADALQKFPVSVQITSKAGNISSAKDFAFVYGTVVNGATRNNYLRVWIYRNKQWQVIVQTLKW
jgi:hypothetical protein